MLALFRQHELSDVMRVPSYTQHTEQMGFLQQSSGLTKTSLPPTVPTGPLLIAQHAICKNSAPSQEMRHHQGVETKHAHSTVEAPHATASSALRGTAVPTIGPSAETTVARHLMSA